ncbi:MAG: SAM-dependent methyltransferase [Hyphomicrobium sp. 32-62-53]|nr:MAG: SAM-dependent methyltransferase [Hyphomicrobium sp. 12-62-95]OYX97211.1 MAG: SAM-dependent methyltransferase [Hyphomicrobium sp. 32-62-53]
MKCRHCQNPLTHVLIDLHHQPASNAYLSVADLERSEVYVPLKTFVCGSCWLVQIPSHHRPDELFTADYAYFSSVSSSWVQHAARYVDAMIARFGLNETSLVAEIASNDGYLLQHARDAGIPCLGIEPTASTAAAARAKGIETLELFFGAETGRKLSSTRQPADLIAANNVLAHVPDINDFVAGFAAWLAPDGVATFEFPHLMHLIDGCQFDTIYHEHYSYLSLTAVAIIFRSKGLRIFDVEELSTHGGSLRVFACLDGASHSASPRVNALLERERAAGLTDFGYYSDLQPRAKRLKLDLLTFLLDEKRAGRRVAAYGAAAKGNTLLNFAGVDADLVDFVCDAALSKQGRFLPGSHIPILAPDALLEAKPHSVLILPWNLKSEIVPQLSYIREWGGRFVTAVPRLEVW